MAIICGVIKLRQPKQTVSGEEEIVVNVYVLLRCHAVKISRGMSLRPTLGPGLA